MLRKKKKIRGKEGDVESRSILHLPILVRSCDGRGSWLSQPKTHTKGKKEDEAGCIIRSRGEEKK